MMRAKSVGSNEVTPPRGCFLLCSVVKNFFSVSLLHTRDTALGRFKALRVDSGYGIRNFFHRIPFGILCPTYKNRRILVCTGKGKSRGRGQIV